MTRQSIATLRQQLAGHHAEKYLVARQRIVSDYIVKNPDYFQRLVSLVGLEPFGSLTGDEAYQLGIGNTGLALKLEGRLQELADKTKSAEEYHGLKRFLEHANQGIETIRQQITHLSTLALDDWTVVQGQDAASFSLESFRWSPTKLDSFSKKERRGNDPKTLINLRDRVIPSKQMVIATKRAEFTKLDGNYRETPEYQRLTRYLALRDNCHPDTEAMYQATREVEKKIHFGGSDDGGYEHDILNNPELKGQWYPQLVSLLEGKGVKCDQLDFLVGHYYVVKYERGSKSKNNLKTRLVPAETDLVLYNTCTREIVAIGEVKSNAYDVPHADYQLSRGTVMMTGQVGLKTLTTHFTEYLETRTSEPVVLDQERITARYLAHKQRIETPVISGSSWSDPVRFIIASPEVDLPGRLHLSSKVATQITHWLYSSEQTPETYIQEKVDTLQDYLGFCEADEVVKRNVVFRIARV